MHVFLRPMHQAEVLFLRKILLYNLLTKLNFKMELEILHTDWLIAV